MKNTTINWSLENEPKTKRMKFTVEVCNDDKIGKNLIVSFVSMCNIFKDNKY